MANQRIIWRNGENKHNVVSLAFVWHNMAAKQLNIWYEMAENGHANRMAAYAMKING